MYKTRSASTNPTVIRFEDGMNGTIRNAMAMRTCLKMKVFFIYMKIRL